MIEVNFCVGSSELLAAMVVCQFTVVNLDMMTCNKRVENVAATDLVS